MKLCNMSQWKENIVRTITPALKQQLGVANVHQVPRLKKVVVNVGLSMGSKEKAALENAVTTLTRITGQKPVTTKARKSISNFKIRQGMDIGAVVTLRGDRMYDFVEKLVRVTFPRVRDFRGVETSAVDAHGNFNYGFKEHVAFPEIRIDEIEKLHGLQVTIATTAGTRERGLALFTALGFPFKKNA